MSTDITKAEPLTVGNLSLSAKVNQQVAAIEAAAADGLAAFNLDAGNIGKMFLLSAAISKLREVLTDEIVSQLTALEGTPLGYRTDKDSKGEKYSLEIVRDCVIEGLIRGARMTGNELNIIAKRAYFTREFYERKVREIPGLTDLEIVEGVPVMSPGGALCSMYATWKHNGKKRTLDCCLVKNGDVVVKDTRIPIRVNEGQIIDAVLGKAKRKMLARVYSVMTGSELSDDAGDDSNTIDAPPTTTPKLEGAKQRIAAKQADKKDPKPPAEERKPAEPTAAAEQDTLAPANEPKPEPAKAPPKPKPLSAEEVYLAEVKAVFAECKTIEELYAMHEAEVSKPTCTEALALKIDELVGVARKKFKG